MRILKIRSKEYAQKLNSIRWVKPDSTKLKSGK
jgi:hypothetical protein